MIRDILKGGDFLNTFAEWLQDKWDLYIVRQMEQFTVWDAIDILLLAALLYCLYVFIRDRRAAILVVGLVVVFALYILSDLLGLRAIHQLLASIAPFTVILVAIIFQNEVREALERLGSSPFSLFSKTGKQRTVRAHTVNEIVDAVCHIARDSKDGALIVIECGTLLGEYVNSGCPIDAVVSSELLCNIFVNGSPLHDGAVIIRANRIAAAGSKLPLSNNEDVVKGLGTRHRAAVGITEGRSCIAIVVSEQRNQISIANNGLLKRDYHRSAQDLHNEVALKSIKNSLRNDLFHILAGMPYDENARADKKDRFKIAFRFRLKRDTDDDQPDKKKATPGGRKLMAKGRKKPLPEQDEETTDESTSVSEES